MERLTEHIVANDTVALFWHGPLSQWWATSLQDEEGVTYNCTEQYMMAKKATLFGDRDTHSVIMAQTGAWDGTQIDFNKYPRAQKALGREVVGFIPYVWEAVRFNVVLSGNLFRTKSDAVFRQNLLLTGRRLIAESSPTDDVWGIGLHMDHEDSANPALWRGKNLLGRALTEVRDSALSCQAVIVG